MIDESQGSIVLGGTTDVPSKYVAPTIVRDVKVDDSLMGEYAISFFTSRVPDLLT